MKARKKAKRLGRPPLTAGRHERVNVTLHPDVIRWLREHGNGNLSGAIHSLVMAQRARAEDREGWTREQMAMED